MPRKGHIQKRDVLADPVYNSKVVTKLINNIMLDGKKGVAQKIVYGAFAKVEDKSGKPALDAFNEAMNNKAITFQLWQASTGKVLMLAPNRQILFAHGYVYGCGEEQPVVFTSSGSETQNITLNAGWNWISTNLNLQPATAALNSVMARMCSFSYTPSAIAFNSSLTC